MYSITDEERAPLIHSDHATTQDAQHVNQSSSSSISSNQDGFIVPKGGALYLALVIPNLNVLLVAMDVTLVSMLSASIASDFSSLSVISWLGTVYLVAMAAMQPISGQLTDRFGRRNGLLFSLGTFLIGNLICGLARDTVAIIVGRVIAGIGGGTTGAVAAYITNDLVPLSQRGPWQGLGGAMWSVGAGLGGVFGGVINDQAGWRWAFLGLTPFTILLGIGAYLTVPVYDIEPSSSKSRVDLPGVFALTSMLVFFILGLNLVDDGHVGWNSLVFLCISAAMLICLIVIELRSDNPIVPIRLLANRSVFGACFSSFFIAALAHVLLFNIPLFIQIQGYNTSEVGRQFLGEPIGGVLGSMIAGFAMESLKSYRLIKPLSFVVALVTPLGFYLSNLSTDRWVAVACVFAMGIGIGGVVSVIMTSIVAVTDPRVQASVTGMMFAFRQSGSSTGLALASVLFRWLTVKLYGDGGGDRAMITKCSQHGHTSAGRPKICYVYGQALHIVFLFAIALSVLAFMCGMMIRDVSLDQDHTVKLYQKKSAPASPVENRIEISDGHLQ